VVSFGTRARVRFRRTAAIGVRIGEGPQYHPQPTFGNGGRVEIKKNAHAESLLKTRVFEKVCRNGKGRGKKSLKPLSELILDFGLAKGKSAVEFREGS
jgi:hypothetical protein